ncbi:MAG: DsrE family protein [Fidelibacterota bacterium]
MKHIILIAGLFLLLINCNQEREEIMNNETTINSLVILWTSNDPEVFTKVIFPYALNSKKQEWWQEVELLIWGPSTKLLAETEALQEKITILQDTGVVLTACLWCADQYDATETLEKLSIDVKYMGQSLTEYLQSGKKVITF